MLAANNEIGTTSHAHYRIAAYAIDFASISPLEFATKGGLAITFAGLLVSAPFHFIAKQPASSVITVDEDSLGTLRVVTLPVPTSETADEFALELNKKHLAQLRSKLTSIEGSNAKDFTLPVPYGTESQPGQLRSLDGTRPEKVKRTQAIKEYQMQISDLRLMVLLDSAANALNSLLVWATPILIGTSNVVSGTIFGILATASLSNSRKIRSTVANLFLIEWTAACFWPLLCTAIWESYLDTYTTYFTSLGAPDADAVAWNVSRHYSMFDPRSWNLVAHIVLLIWWFRSVGWATKWLRQAISESEQVPIPIKRMGSAGLLAKMLTANALSALSMTFILMFVGAIYALASSKFGVLQVCFAGDSCG